MNYRGIVHSAATLVDADTETAPHFLATRDRVVTVFQHAHDEDVGIIPAFAKCRVGEDEPHRLLE